ncbi:MAG: methyl-accepting chemotaxis protein, partial [Desulfamplus sp.]|nr:methyl-accepting chemotaxis protein [Desulfamplus sp.]
MSCISLIIILILTILIWNAVDSQNKLHNSQVKQQNQMLADAVEGGMFDALAIGDNDVVKAQFERLNEKLSGLKVFVYDFNGKISFATDTDQQGKNITEIIDGEAASGVKTVLNSEKEKDPGKEKTSDTMYHNNFDGEPYTISHKVIPNEKRCFHCHGGSKEILGGITVCSSEALSLENIRTSRNKSFIIGITGLIVIVVMIWILFHYLVNTRLALITKISGRMSQGDFTNDISVTGNNEISTILAGSKKMNHELKEMISKVVYSCNDLVIFSKNLENVSSSMSNHAEQTSKKSKQVAVAADEMSSNLGTITSAMEQTASNLDMMASASEEMHTTASEISKSTVKAKNTIEKSAEEFKHSAEVVEELG